MTSNDITQIPLVQKFPNLSQFPYQKIVNAPTPVELLPKISANLPGYQIYVKRDDLTNDLYGGNKPRKFEFVFPHLLQQKKSTLLAVGGLGTNQGLAMALHSSRLHMHTHLYLIDQPLLPEIRTNLLCDYAAGATMHFTKNRFYTAMYILGKLLTNPHATYIPPGASTARGAIGFVNAALELEQQIQQGLLPEPRFIFVAVGSCGTAAGLLLGLALSRLKTQIYGIGVTDLSMSRKQNVVKLASQAWRTLHRYDPNIPDVRDKLDKRLIVDHSLFGGLYGRLTKEGLHAIDLAQQDGLALDPVYTAKAFSGLVEYCRKHASPPHPTSVLYWHTKNSTSLSPLADKVDFHQLPRQFHRFFDGTVPFTDEIVSCMEEEVLQK